MHHLCTFQQMDNRDVIVLNLKLKWFVIKVKYIVISVLYGV